MALIITKKTRGGAQKENWPVVRVNEDNYKDVVKISRLTGRSLRDITSQLLDYALDHVEIVEE